MPARPLSRTRRLVVPPPTRLQAALAFPEQLSTGLRLYRTTPARLRRPEPLLRLAVGVVSVWFTSLFGALAVFTIRTAAADALHRGPTWAYAYLGAAALGPVAFALVLTRRHRAGFGALAAMFVLGQAATLAAIL
jgi:hypothetical protein